jgi:mono/diheme cytochrome c family protein
MTLRGHFGTITPMRFAIFALAAFLASAAAQATERAVSVPGPRSGGELKQVARSQHGARLYRANCLACHDESGAGSGPAARERNLAVPDFTAPAAVTRFSRGAMLAALAKGHAADTAGIWKDKLSPQDIEAVIDYLRDAFMLPAATADASAGRRIYARTCSVCHGDRGNASSWAKGSLNPPPFDFTSYKAKQLSRRHMINTVTYGKDGTAMVGWAIQLTREEIAAVVDYVRATFIFPGDAPPPSPIAGNRPLDIPSFGNSTQSVTPDDDRRGMPANMGEPFPKRLVGNLERGKALFLENCSPCHGKGGNGDGPRAYFIFPRPENFTGKRSRTELNRPALFGSIGTGIVGTVMPAWSTVLDEQAVADVAEYVFTTFINVADAGPAPSEPGAADETKKK